MRWLVLGVDVEMWRCAIGVEVMDRLAMAVVVVVRAV